MHKWEEYIGINHLAGSPNIRMASNKVNDGGFAVNEIKTKLYIDVLSIGSTHAENLKVERSALKDYIKVSDSDSKIDGILIFLLWLDDSTLILDILLMEENNESSDDTISN